MKQKDHPTSSIAPEISIIVPVFNLENLLPKCIQSVLEQTFQNYELLLINDGSTDRSGAICDEFAAGSNGKIRAVHCENRGAGGARNTGIDLAHGEYLCFIDGDDHIDAAMLETLHRTANDLDSDLLLFGMQIVNEQGRILRTELDQLPPRQPLTLEAHPEIFFSLPRVCSKFCRRRLFTQSGLRFPERIWYEDFRMATKLLCEAETIVSLDEPYYFYLQRMGSTMQNTNCERNAEILSAFDDIIRFYQSKGLFDRYKNQIEYLAIYHLYIAASVRVINANRKHPLLKQLKTYLTQQFPDYRNNPYLKQLDRNKQLVYKLLEKNHYFIIFSMFKIKSWLNG